MRLLRYSLGFLCLTCVVAVACSDLRKGAWLGPGDVKDLSNAEVPDADAKDLRPEVGHTDVIVELRAGDIEDLQSPDTADTEDIPEICVPNNHRECIRTDSEHVGVYWVDSCGTQGDLVQACACGCADGACVTDCKQCPDGYVEVPPGTFTMGSPAGELGREFNETQHEVTITRGFCVKSTEVTQAEWSAVVGNTPAYHTWCGGNCPVEMVSWWDSVTYCNLLSQRDGLPECYVLAGCTGKPGDGNYMCTGATLSDLSCTGYRLPTEAEWEYMARAGTLTATWNGNPAVKYCAASDPVLDPIAWYKGNSCEVAPQETCSGGAGCQAHPVAQKLANPWGLYDILGNVGEWTWDSMGSYSGRAVDPLGAAGSGAGTTTPILYRSIRGGEWSTWGFFSRAAKRDWAPPEYRYRWIGLRPIRTQCVPDCDGRECGSDGCMGFCGTTPCAVGKQCVDGQCTCVSHSSQKCIDGKMFWFDSCGQQEGEAYSCTCGCLEDACRPCGCPADHAKIPAGKFAMGAPASEACSQDDERPVRTVTISQSFCLKETEVTQSEFQLIMEVNPSLFLGCGDSCPAGKVSWWSALAYCNRKSDLEGLGHCYEPSGCSGTPGSSDYKCTTVTTIEHCTGYRLPTEAEWEFAARGGEQKATYGGDAPAQSNCADCAYDAILNALAWWCGNALSLPKTVGGRDENKWGLKDMLGNVSEWVFDRYGPYPDGAEVDPTGPQSGPMRVLRGGSFSSPAGHIRSASRDSGDPSQPQSDWGFRTARTPCASDIECQLGMQCDGETGACITEQTRKN